MRRKVRKKASAGARKKKEVKKENESEICRAKRLGKHLHVRLKNCKTSLEI